MSFLAKVSDGSSSHAPSMRPATSAGAISGTGISRNFNVDESPPLASTHFMTDTCCKSLRVEQPIVLPLRSLAVLSGEFFGDGQDRRRRVAGIVAATRDHLERQVAHEGIRLGADVRAADVERAAGRSRHHAAAAAERLDLHVEVRGFEKAAVYAVERQGVTLDGCRAESDDGRRTLRQRKSAAPPPPQPKDSRTRHVSSIPPAFGGKRLGV